jgi:hypothetical protein
VTRVLALAIWWVIATPWQSPTDTGAGVTTTAPPRSTSSTSSGGSSSTTQRVESKDNPSGFAPIATILAALIGAGGTYLVLHVKNRYDKEATKRTEDREDLVSRHDKQQERLAARHTEERSRQERRHTAERNELREAHKTERTEHREDYELKRTEQKPQHVREQEKLLERHAQELSRLDSSQTAQIIAINQKHESIRKPLQEPLWERSAIQGAGAQVSKELPALKAIIASGGNPKEVPGRQLLEDLRDASESLSPAHFKKTLQDVISRLTVYESSNLDPDQWVRLWRELPEVINQFEKSLVEYLEEIESQSNSLETRLAEVEEPLEAERRRSNQHARSQSSQLREAQKSELLKLIDRHAQDEMKQIEAERTDMEHLGQQQDVALIALTDRQREEERELERQQSTEVANLDATQLKEIEALKAKNR